MGALNGAVIGRSLGEVGGTILGIALCLAVLEVVLYLLFQKLWRHRLAVPIMLITPAAIGLTLLIVIPLLYELRLAFSNMNLYRFKNPQFGLGIAIDNFKRIFTQPVLKQVRILPLLFRTFLWTFIQITFHVAGGLTLAMLLTAKSS